MCDQDFVRHLHHLSTAADDDKARTPESIDAHIYSTSKRHSSSSPSKFQEPLLKRATLQSPPSAALAGYTKLQLPHPFPTPSPSATSLRRTLSEPIYSPRQLQNAAAVTTVTPPRPPNSGGGSQRMKRMRAKMIALWNEVASEEDADEEDDSAHPHNSCCNPKEESENGVENGCSQEAVWVDKNGENLMLHFKCPCGNGYEVLLSGSTCYYKLTNF